MIPTSPLRSGRCGWSRWLKRRPNCAPPYAACLRSSLIRVIGKEGWTLRQVVHHLADAQLNGFTRFKLALTEDRPAIKTYEEDLWSETADGREAPVNLSVDLLTALHARWVILLESLTESGFARTFRHPQRGELRFDDGIQLYAWRGIHHTAHISKLRERTGW